MSARSRRGRPDQDEILPGMPDALAEIPPKAKEYQALTLDAAIGRAHSILDRVIANNPAEHVLTLFSGGGDSSVMAHLMRSRVDAMVHVDTGISIPACGEYVRAVAAEWRLPLRIAEPEDSYRDLVLGQVKAKTKDRAVWVGFPGPAGHRIMYQRLKERALERLRRDLVGPRGKTGQIVFVGGMRWAESDRRFRNAEEFDPWGAVVWCSPLVWWTAGHMAEYRDRYMCHETHTHAPHRLCWPGALPRSEVTDHLHMSGDCLCGAFARPAELDEIAFFYPEVAARLRSLERETAAAGIRRCVWGAGKEAGEATPEAAGPLCSRCVPEFDGQQDILDLWVEQGLLTPDVAQALRPSAT